MPRERERERGKDSHEERELISFRRCSFAASRWQQAAQGRSNLLNMHSAGSALDPFIPADLTGVHCERVSPTASL